MSERDPLAEARAAAAADGPGPEDDAAAVFGSDDAGARVGASGAGGPAGAGGGPAGDAGLARLRAWALLDPTVPLHRSSRRLGRISDRVRGALQRLLQRDREELAARQTRVNVALLEELEALRERVAELERRDR